MIGLVPFYGTVMSCDIGVRNTKQWKIVYDNGDDEIIPVTGFRESQRLYAREQEHNTVGNQRQPAPQQPQSSLPSTTN